MNFYTIFFHNLRTYAYVKNLKKIWGPNSMFHWTIPHCEQLKTPERISDTETEMSCVLCHEGWTGPDQSHELCSSQNAENALTVIIVH